MHPHEQLIHDLYRAFQRRDGPAMAACYHPEATFSDPVFTGLRGPEVGGMWKMLCERAKDLAIEYRDVSADEGGGRAHWDARYTFSTGRRVLNRIDAEFRFRDGKIVDHRDRFGLWRWARQALGPAGLLLGWTPLVRGKIRRMARKGLDEYLARAPR